MKSLLSTLVLAGVATAGLGAQAVPDVQVTSSGVTVRANGASRQEIVKRVADAAGVDIIGLDHVDGAISVTFEAEPLDDAMAELLAGYSYVLARKPGASDGASFRLRIIGGPAGATGTGLVSGSAAAAGVPPAAISVPALAALQIADAESTSPDDEDPQDAEIRRDEEDELTEMDTDGEFADTVAIGDLLATLKESDNALVRGRILEAVNRRSPERALKPLVAALSDDDERVAQTAQRLLGLRRDPASLAALGGVVTGKGDMALKVAALQTLAERADPASLPFLKTAAADPDPMVREIATQMSAELEQRIRNAKATAR